MPIKPILMFALTCGLVGVAAADQNVATALNDQYRDKVMALRHSFKSNVQEYAVDGTPLHPEQEGPWTLFGRVKVDKISLDAREMIVTGKRVQCFFDGNGDLVWFPEDRKHRAERITITVHSPAPLASVDEAQAIIGHVFALTTPDMLNAVPAPWQPYLRKHFGIEAEKKESSGQAAAPEGAPKIEALSLADLSDKKHVSPPNCSPRPEPQFLEDNRSRRLQGVVGLYIVIDETGKVSRMTIGHPVGMGLDETTMDGVSRWRCEPATRDGQPVAVPVYVEVDLHLH